MDTNQELLKKLESFVPKYTDNDDYLEELFTFLEKIIHGDDISQYRASAYWSIYAEEAIKKIAKTVQENGLADFEERKNRLLEELQSRKVSLTRDIDSLEASKKWYTSQNEELKQTADSKRDKLSELDEKIKKKEQRVQELEKINSTLRKSIREYNQIISNISGTNGFKVIWMPICDDDPIYKINHWTVREYFELLKLRYMKYTGKSEEETEKDFIDNMPNYKDFIELMANDFCNKKTVGNLTLKTIINHDNWSSESEEQVKKLKAMVKMMKMPVYVPNIERNVNHSINTSTMSDNISQALREIELKRQILEYAARNRILQNEVEVLMNILKSVVPNNADLTNILNSYNALGLLQTDEDCPLSREK